jgi:uncharacterized membrane protein YeaQ/YmgE (transglycosylase-associated protein family)
MEEHQIGWIAAIIIGGIAGWLAEQFMKSQMGLVMNIVLGIIGAAVASWLLGFLGISLGGWIGYLIAGFIGACILIAIARAFSGGLQRMNLHRWRASDCWKVPGGIPKKKYQAKARNRWIVTPRVGRPGLALRGTYAMLALQLHRAAA